MGISLAPEVKQEDPLKKKPAPGVQSPGARAFDGVAPVTFGAATTQVAPPPDGGGLRLAPPPMTAPAGTAAPMAPPKGGLQTAPMTAPAGTTQVAPPPPPGGGLRLAPDPKAAPMTTNDGAQKFDGPMANSTGMGTMTAPPISLAPSAPKATPSAAPAGTTQVPPPAGGLQLAQAPAIPTPTVAPPSSPVDRVKLATDTFNNLAGQRQTQYQADSRDNIRSSAAMGQVASGGLRTREGDLRLARERDLDTLQKDLTLKATEGSIADASTAYQQQLAASQQGLAGELGRGGLEVSKGGLELEKEKAGTSASQTQQQIDLAKKQQDIDTRFKEGSMSLAERNAALQELQNQQQFGLEGEKLGLAKEQTAAQQQQAAAALALQEKLGLGGLSAEQQRIAIAEKQQAIEAAYQNKQIDLATKNQQLAELAQAQNNALDTERLGLAKTGQEADIANQTAQLGLAKEQLAQSGKQFGLSLAQQKELATLADKTQNRQLDISGAQGQTSLMLELARIMGSKDASAIDPSFLASIAKALGIAAPKQATTPPPPPGNGGGSRGTGEGEGETGGTGGEPGSGEPGDPEAIPQEYYDPDPNSPTYNPDTSLPWRPTTPAPPSVPVPPPAPIPATDKERYYDPDPNSPTYNPDTSLPWRPG